MLKQRFSHTNYSKIKIKRVNWTEFQTVGEKYNVLDAKNPMMLKKTRHFSFYVQVR